METRHPDCYKMKGDPEKVACSVCGKELPTVVNYFKTESYDCKNRCVRPNYPYTNVGRMQTARQSINNEI